ncbi:MAG: DUF2175 family protein [Thermoproteota archaeon]
MPEGSGFRKWKCILCGDDVIEGQRFVFVPRRGFAHLECVSSRVAASGVLDAEVAALLDAVEAVSYAIVRLKTAERAVPEGSVSREVGEVRKKIEGLAARLEALLVEELSGRGLDLAGQV